MIYIRVRSLQTSVDRGPQMSRYILVNLFCKFGTTITTILTPIYNIMLKYDQGAW